MEGALKPDSGSVTLNGVETALLKDQIADAVVRVKSKTAPV
nr:hypothetical protein P5658_05035 [Bacillus subtilis]